MFNLIFPANISMFNSIIINIATFDIVPFIDEIIEEVFNFRYSLSENELMAQGFELLGFDTKNFIINSGSLTIFVIDFII